METLETTELKLDALREKDLLISTTNEVLEVDKALGKNSLCYENELAFRLKSLDHKEKYSLITGQLSPNGTLTITGFKKYQPHSGLN